MPGTFSLGGDGIGAFEQRAPAGNAAKVKFPGGEERHEFPLWT